MRCPLDVPRNTTVKSPVEVAATAVKRTLFMVQTGRSITGSPPPSGVLTSRPQKSSPIVCNFYTDKEKRQWNIEIQKCFFLFDCFQVLSSRFWQRSMSIDVSLNGYRQLKQKNDNNKKSWTITRHDWQYGCKYSINDYDSNVRTESIVGFSHQRDDGN